MGGPLVVMVVGVVISVYFYFGWIREAIFPPLPAFEKAEEERRASLSLISPSFGITFFLFLLIVVVDFFNN